MAVWLPPTQARLSEDEIAVRAHVRAAIAAAAAAAAHAGPTDAAAVHSAPLAAAAAPHPTHARAWLVALQYFLKSVFLTIMRVE